jgi:hypothetical protein
MGRHIKVKGGLFVGRQWRAVWRRGDLILIFRRREAIQSGKRVFNLLHIRFVSGCTNFSVFSMNWRHVDMRRMTIG